MVVNNNAAAVLLVLAALAAGREVPVSRGESVEIGGGFRVPEVIEQSGARLVDVGTTNRTRLADYRSGDRPPRRGRRPRAQGAPEQLPPRRASSRTPPVAELADARACPSSSTSAAACSTPTCPWLPGPHPPAWLAGEPAAGPDPGRRRRPRDVQRRQAARRARRPGSSSGAPTWSRRCARHPLARALRPGGLVLSALQDVGARLPAPRRRRDGAVLAAGHGARSTSWPPGRGRSPPAPAARRVATEALPGAGSAPGATIPSWGVAVAGDHLAALRGQRPAGHRPGDGGPDRPRPARGRAGRRRRARRRARLAAPGGAAGRREGRSPPPATSTTASRRSCRRSPAPTRTGCVEEKRRGLTIDLGFAHTVRRGEAISFVDVPGHVRFLRNMLAGVGGVDACLFVVAATEGWKPQSEEHLRILELLGVTNGVVALTKVDLLGDDELVELATLERGRPRRRHVPRRRADRPGRRPDRRRARPAGRRARRARPAARRRPPTGAALGCGSTASSPPRAAARSSPAR